MSIDAPGPFRQFIVPIIAYVVVVYFTTQSATQTETDSSQTPPPAVIPEQVAQETKTLSETASTETNQSSTTSQDTNEASTNEQVNPDSAIVDNSTTENQDPNSNATSQTDSKQNSSLAVLPQTNQSPSSSANGFDNPSGTNDSNRTASPIDINSAVDQLIAAEGSGDRQSIDRAQQFLTALPKPPQGDIDDADRLNKLGLKDLRAKSFQTSVGFFANASKDDPSNALYLSNLGYAEMNCGELDSAEQHLRASIALDASRSVAWGDLALTFAKKGDQNRAVTCLLIGYRVSSGKSISFIQWLQQDKDSAVRDVASMALAKLQQNRQ
jgi:predicted Zn-dependent protease